MLSMLYEFHELPMTVVHVQLWLFFRKHKSFNQNITTLLFVSFVYSESPYRYNKSLSCIASLPLNQIFFFFADWSAAILLLHCILVLLFVHLSITIYTVNHGVHIYVFTVIHIGLVWFRADFSNRHHIGKHNSATAKVIQGVPQGSVLGLLTFFIYMPAIVISHVLSRNLVLLLDWPNNAN